VPGGLVGDDESLEEAVQRELKEETGVNINYLEQLYSFGKPGRDGINKLKNNGLIKKLICTDSHVNTQFINDDFVKVRSLAELICEAL